MDTEGLRSAARCVFIATSEDAAKDLSQRLNWAADEIDRLQAENAALREKVERVADMIRDHNKDIPLRYTGISEEAETMLREALRREGE